jgi:hypothetical protein
MGRNCSFSPGRRLSPTLVSVAVRTTSSGLEADTPKPLFEVRGNDWHPVYSTFFDTPIVIAMIERGDPSWAFRQWSSLNAGEFQACAVTSFVRCEATANGPRRSPY